MTSKIKVDNINKVSDDSNIINKCGTTITLGASGDSIALASGATQSGFGRTGTVDWQTTPKTATFTAVNGEGYFCNTTAGTFTMNLPAGSAGAIVSLQDYNNTFDTFSLTVDPNGSEKINGGTAGDFITLSTEGLGITFVYIDATVGWRSVQSNEYATAGAPLMVAATVSGSCNAITEDGDYKIATFKNPGTFCVSQVSPVAANNAADYLVVAGGASGGGDRGGGGGAGGFRYFLDTTRCAPTSGAPAAPLNGYGSPTPSGTAITLAVAPYTIAVGGGGTGSTGGQRGTNGDVSTFDTITSAGGGSGGGCQGSPTPGANGGSGGGGRDNSTSPGGNGNSPPVTPPQGEAGGSSTSSNCYAGGGGGAMAAGGVGASPSGGGGAGGGLPTAFGANGVPCGSYRYYAGGGEGGSGSAASTTGGGIGGGGPRGSGTPGVGVAGTINTGGGSGGGNNNTNPGNAGGSGIVVIRYKFK